MKQLARPLRGLASRFSGKFSASIEGEQVRRAEWATHFELSTRASSVRDKLREIVAGPPALQILGEICSNFFERTPHQQKTFLMFFCCVREGIPPIPQK